jgi:hypothetical protein
MVAATSVQYERELVRKPKLTQYGDYATWVTFEVMANYRVRLVLTKDLLKSSERLGTRPELGASTDAFCFHVAGEGRSYIFLQLNSSESTVAHECWHIVHKVLAYCGVIDLDSELVAYYLDHMVEKVYEFKKAILQRKKEVK